MDTKTLLEIIQTRIEANDNNPTKAHILRSINEALEKLYEYEQKDAEKRADGNQTARKP